MTLEEFNNLDKEEAKTALRNCCATTAWVDCMVNLRPYRYLSEVFQYADVFWDKTNKYDWLEAFEGHPKIGDIKSLKGKFAATAVVAAGEQSAVEDASEEVLTALITRNEAYLAKFGFIFIVYATGKSVEEILGILNDRLLNEKERELKTAAEEQRKITRKRLQKLFA